MIDQPKQSPIIRSQGHNPFSATRVIIETDIEARRCNNYFERIIKKTAIRVHYTTETISKLTVTSMNCLKAGFH